jgi:hypothetical protein
MDVCLDPVSRDARTPVPVETSKMYNYRVVKLTGFSFLSGLACRFRPRQRQLTAVLYSAGHGDCRSGGGLARLGLRPTG